MNTEIETIKINGVDYVLADQVQPTPKGNRCVVVIDRGWIYAGDVTDEAGRIKLTRAVWVFRWESIGFSGVIDDPKNGAVDIRKLSSTVDIPASAELWLRRRLRLRKQQRLRQRQRQRQRLRHAMRQPKNRAAITIGA